jgi:hypothetical protein
VFDVVDGKIQLIVMLFRPAAIFGAAIGTMAACLSRQRLDRSLVT